MKKIAGLNLIIALLMLPISVLAAMSSTNYMIYADSLETGGGLSGGGNYSLEDTIGEGIISGSAGSIYNIKAGYQAMVLGSLAMNINNNSLSLGDLSTTEIKSASTTITITTDSTSGYSLSIQSVSGVGLTAVGVDGTVDIGVEEYGLAVSGFDAVFANDRSVTAGQILANKTSPAVGSQTIITFKAAISSATTQGDKSQVVSVGVSANF
ncbi:MAG: hypothetical protein Q7J14_01215 [Candidatus Magasanikbacteria bacterium]|nr:hypothetical protein [Candidatus Magasanikbacteria bacterium]